MTRETTMSGPETALDCTLTDDDTDVRRDLLGVLFGHTGTIVAGNVAVSLTASLVLAAADGQTRVWPWLAALSVLVALRVALVRKIRPEIDTLSCAELDRVEWQYAALTGLTGLVWGVLPWISYQGRDPFIDFFSVAMLAGMSGGAVAATTALPRAFFLYLVCALLPFIVKSWFMGGPVNIGGGLTFLFYLVLLLSFGRNAHDTLRKTLQLTRQNAQLADGLRRERDAAHAAVRAKNLFLAGVTHDLRQPVHALGLHVRYLRSRAPATLDRTTLDEACSGMDAAVKTMSNQLTRLLELSRLEAGEARILRRALPLAGLWSACAAQFGPLAADKGLELIFRPTDATVDSDAMMLQSMLDNLVSNAVRYTDAGRVLVAARPRGPQIELQVRDSGPGIAEEHLPQIFEPYRRFDDRSKLRDGGQGLGLALVRRQAGVLGHTLSVRSRPGQGSVFALRLPRASASPS